MKAVEDAFLHYIEDTTDEFATQAKSNLIKEIQQKVNSVKADQRIEVEYMILLEREREKFQEGVEQGIEQSISVFKLFMAGANTEEIA